MSHEWAHEYDHSRFMRVMPFSFCGPLPNRASIVYGRGYLVFGPIITDVTNINLYLETIIQKTLNAVITIIIIIQCILRRGSIAHLRTTESSCISLVNHDAMGMTQFEESIVGRALR